MRAFVALILPDEILDRLEDLQAAIPVGRIAQRDALHLTLEFLGDQSDDDIEAAHAALSRLAPAAFDLGLSGTDTFGRRSPSLLYAGVSACPPLTDLQKSVRSALRAAGLQFDRQRFRPHVTLARFARQMPAGDIVRLREALIATAGFATPPVRIDSFALYRSTLGRGPPIHDELARYALG